MSLIRIRDMYISRIEFMIHIMNSGLNSKTALHTSDKM